MTLLEKAKNIKINNIGRPRERISTNQEMDLAIGWLKGEIGQTQVCKALNRKISGNVQYALSVYLRDAYKKGKLKINE